MPRDRAVGTAIGKLVGAATPVCGFDGPFTFGREDRVQFYIGTSGWVYPHWQGRFYPDDLAEPDWLDYYAGYLNSVEINRSFYRLPTVENFTDWCDGTPDDFVFAVKASRYITHNFNNDESAYAVRNARELKEMLE